MKNYNKRLIISLMLLSAITLLFLFVHPVDKQNKIEKPLQRIDQKLSPVDPVASIAFNQDSTKQDFTRVLSQKINPLVVPNKKEDKLLTFHFGKVVISALSSVISDQSNLNVVGLTQQETGVLNNAMVNVNGEYYAYRMQPDSTKFSQDITLEIPYDLAKIPVGYMPQDIRTYYFDTSIQYWVQVPYDSVDTKNQVIISHVNHFTDFMNAIVKQPDMPETTAFVPTSISKLPSPKPTDGISLISAPTANNQGTANLSYPISLPGGRNGMQPQLSISYSSAGGSGWLGVGWSLSESSITVETRWGVPLYSDTLETETYLLNGQPLVQLEGENRLPLTYREAYRTRTSGEVYFAERTEGNFLRIIRHGDSPVNYWWEVVTKDGLISYYGKSHDDDVLDPNAVLQARRRSRFPDNFIAKWGLSEIRDLHHNRMFYYYDTQKDSTKEERYLYLQSIFYTLNSGDQQDMEQAYKVEFVRKCRSKLGMVDNSFSCRTGLKEQNDDLLTNIIVSLKSDENAYSKNYHFEYQQGEFGKTLLKKIELMDPQPYKYSSTIVLFALDYYKKPNEIFGDEHRLGYGSISNTKSWSVSGGARVGGGFGCNVFSNKCTISGNGDMNSGESHGTTSFYDIDGDGLPDKIFKESNGLYFSPLIKNGDTLSFAQKQKIKGPNVQFLFQKSKGYSYGAQAQSNHLSGSLNRRENTSTTTNYFCDIDGNNLPDIVDDGKVYYNKGYVDGNLTFSTDNSTVVYMGGSCGQYVSKGEDVNDDIYLNTPIYNPYIGEPTSPTNYKTNKWPQYETVRMWVAPYDGVVAIENDISVIPGMAKLAQDLNINDGMKCSIQHKKVCDIIATIFPTSSPDTISKTMTVTRGDKIFFRLISGSSRNFDQVIWNPIITYTQTNFPSCSPRLDAENNDVFKFNAKSDFFVNGNGQMQAPLKGEVKIEHTISILEPLSSTIYIKVKKNGHVCDSLTEVVNKGDLLDHYISNSYALTVDEGDSIEVAVETYGGNVKWNAIKLQTELYYTKVDSLPDFNPIDSLSNLSDTLNAHPNHTISVDINPKFQQYPNTIFPSQSHCLDIGTVDTAYLELNSQTISTLSDTLLFVIKTPNNYLYHTYITDINQVPINMYFCANKTYFFDVFTKKSALAEQLDSINIVIAGKNYSVGIHTIYDDNYLVFGPMYRHWGQFSYNNIDQTSDCIDESKLCLDTLLISNFDTKSVTLNIDTSSTASCFNDIDSIVGDMNPNKGVFMPMNPDIELNVWMSIGKESYIAQDTMSNIAHLLAYHKNGITLDTLDLVTLPTPYVRRGQIIHAPGKRSYSETNSFSLGLNGYNPDDFTPNVPDPSEVNPDVIPGPSNPFYPPFSFSISKSSNFTDADFMDINGDGYPDVIATSRVQYSQAQGGLSKLCLQSLPNNQCVANTKSTSFGPTFGGTYDTGIFLTSNNAKDCKSFAAAPGVSSMRSLDKGQYSLIDVNGDGLPDKVERESQEVYINYGYSFFLSSQVQSLFSLNNSSSSSCSLSPPPSSAFNKDSKSISFGVDFQGSANKNNSSFIDINGDGLSDIIFDDGVQYNLGTTFSALDSIKFSALDNIKFSYQSTSVMGSASVNGTFTLGFSLFGYKLTGSSSGSVNLSTTYDEKIYQDMNADGLVDILYKKERSGLGMLSKELSFIDNGEYYYRLNTLYNVNLLKSVHNAANGVINLEYAQTTSSIKDPHSRTVLSKVSVVDFDYKHKSIDLDTIVRYEDGCDMLIQTFEYQEPIFDRYERDFYGYKTVKTQQRGMMTAIYRTSIDEYLNDHYQTKGFLALSLGLDSRGDTISYKRNDYAMKQISDGVVVPGDSAFCYGATYPALNKQTTRIYDLQTQVYCEVVEKYYHTSFGNIKRIKKYGNPNTSADDLIIDIQYVDDQNNLNIKDKVSSVQAVDYNKIVMRETHVEWNMLNGEMKSFARLNDVSTQNYATTNYLYDSYGCVTEVKLPKNANGERMTYTYTYDATHHSAIESITDSYGYQSETYYDPFWNLPVKVYDLNGNGIYYEYDKIGRVVNVLSQKEKEFTLHYNYSLNFDNSEYRLYPIWCCTQRFDEKYPDIDEDGIYSGIIVDGLGRQLQTWETWSDDLQSSRVSGLLVYDWFGRVVKEYEPVIVNKKTNLKRFFLMNNKVHQYADNLSFTQKTYDVADRVTSVIFPDNTKVFTNYSVTQNGIKQELLDGKGNITSSTTDALGRTVEMEDAKHAITYSFYNAAGELTQTLDPNNLPTNYSYDQGGRMIQRDHPDAHSDYFEYDNCNHIIRKWNTKNITGVDYNYYFNQLVVIKNQQEPNNYIQYTYGNDPQLNNVGRVTRVESASGWKYFEYGILGECIKDTRTMIVPNEKQAFTFTMQYNYDSFGRMLDVIYPDGEQVNYSYYLNGLLRKMGNSSKNYINEIDYNKYSKRTDIIYGNGTRSHFDYDINQRLEHLETYNSHNESLQDILYSFDRNSNIEHVENRASKTSTSLGGQYTKDYTYDERNWLKEADGAYQNKSYSFHQEMQYDLDGKMVNKLSGYGANNVGGFEQNNYQYINNTHEIETLVNQDGGEINYEWDLAGNLISMEGDNFRRVHKWNVYNQLSAVFEEGEQKVSYYLYDESGDRTCKLIRHSDGKLDDCVLYPSPFIVATTTGYTKHYYEGSDHLLSKIGNGGITELNTVYEESKVIDDKQDEVNQAYEEIAQEVSSDEGFDTGESVLDNLLSFEKVLSFDIHTYYYHKDYLGSSAWITDEKGIEVQYLDYLPWGESFVNEDRGFNARYTFTGKELDKETGYQYFGARYNEPARLGWLSVDPLAEKSYNVSPYVYCHNNPINRVDPNGLTDFTFDKKNGNVKQVGEKNDDPDRILKTNRKGEVKYKKNGKARVAVGGIERGILKDGQNFKNEDQVISVGGKGQASVEGVKSFTLKLSEYVGTEIAGFSYSSNGSGDATDMLLGHYKNNLFRKCYCKLHELQIKYGSNFSCDNVLQQFHTHPNGELGATRSAPEYSQDVKALQTSKPFVPNASFIILYRITFQEQPAEYDYTHEYRP